MATTKKTATKKTTGAKQPTAKKATAEKAPAKKAAKKSNRGMSAIDAAAKVLGEANELMNAKQMIEQMAAKGYWKSPGGKTPAGTLYAAILRELQTKGKDARFKKTDRGLFTVNK